MVARPAGRRAGDRADGGEVRRAMSGSAPSDPRPARAGAPGPSDAGQGPPDQTPAPPAQGDPPDATANGVRAAIALIFVATLIALVFFGPRRDNSTLPATAQTLTIAVIAFYFGSVSRRRSRTGTSGQ
jgi:hypothetical protein